MPVDLFSTNKDVGEPATCPMPPFVQEQSHSAHAIMAAWVFSLSHGIVRVMADEPRDAVHYPHHCILHQYKEKKQKRGGTFWTSQQISGVFTSSCNRVCLRRLLPAIGDDQ
jgi:hypothetical protein